MNDLLKDSIVVLQREDPKDNDIEMGRINGKNSAEVVLESFFKQVNEVEQQIDKLSKLLRRLQDSNEEYKALTKAETMKAIRKRMSKDIDEVGKIAVATKTKIETLDKDNLTNRQKSGCGPGTGVDRSRTGTTVVLKNKFKEKMSEFQTLRNTIHQDHRELVERKVFTVTGNHADEETIDLLIETGQSEQIFQKAIQEQGRGQVLDSLHEIQERHDIVREIESKLLELQQIFLDMSVLVETQGDMLNNIECHVSTAVEHVNNGKVALEKAKTHQRNSRKWMCIAIILLLIIVAVIVLGVLKPWQQSSSSSSNNNNNGKSG